MRMKNDVLVLNGGLATELEERGYDLSSKLWSSVYLLRSPEVLQQIHQDTFQAGADVVSTATYQVSVPRLLAEGLGVAEAKEVIASSVQLVKAAAVGAGKPNGQIAGACGPYGAYLADASEYTGNYDIPEEEMKNFHRPRIGSAHTTTTTTSEALVSSGERAVGRCA
eukprot:GHVS01063191.1.p2 GENE.GHVS01063191.1~~GHVS01063191.1.p2  ORF type:complete len:167 (+),score=37.82 GHVS01063191.1:99-599(+)